MEKAPIEKFYEIAGYEDIQIGRVHWPMSAIRINSRNKQNFMLNYNTAE